MSLTDDNSNEFDFKVSRLSLHMLSWEELPKNTKKTNGQKYSKPWWNKMLLFKTPMLGICDIFGGDSWHFGVDPDPHPHLWVSD